MKEFMGDPRNRKIGSFVPLGSVELRSCRESSYTERRKKHGKYTLGSGIRYLVSGIRTKKKVLLPGKIVGTLGTS